MSRLLKQTIIGLVFLLILVLFGYGTYELVRERPSCADGIQNGKEEGVDCGVLACGISCKPEILPLNIKEEHIFQIGLNDFDYAAAVKNPNSAYGTSNVAYDLVGRNQENNEVWRVSGSFYILPGQMRHIVVPQLVIDEGISVQMDIRSAEWQAATLPIPQFTVRRQSISAENGTSVEAIVFNESDYDFDRVDVSVILYDAQGNPIGAARSDIRTFLSRTERSFKVTWPANITIDAQRADIQVTTNIFENSNFIKANGTQDKFQEYY